MDKAQYEGSLKINNDGDVYVPNRAARRRKPITPPGYTKKSSYSKSDADKEAIRQRILRKEKGEQERIAKKKEEKENARGV